MNAYNTYGYRGTAKRKSASTAMRLLRAIFAVICERICAAHIRAIALGVGFVVSLGIVGGMESGIVPLYIGLPLCLVFAAAGLLMRFED